MRKKYFAICGSILMLSLIVSISLKAQSSGQNVDKAYADISGKIQDAHPRLFINTPMLRDVRRRAGGIHEEHFSKTKSRIDGIIDQEIVFADLTITDGTQSKDHQYGIIASDAALLYLVTGEQRYLDYTKQVLKKLVEYYTFRNEKNLSIHWYAYSRMCALSAFDWIYNDLSEKERMEIGKPLLQAIDTMVFLDGRKRQARENRGTPYTGYYGNPTLAWYAGLAFYKTGIDDVLAEKLLKKGFEDHWELLTYRQKASGDDGGSATGVMAYAIEAYPWAEFNFFHTVKSATGVDMAAQWKSSLDFLYYTAWNWLPHDLHFGYGDVDHFTNKLPLQHIYVHLAQIKHFYQDDHPEIIPLLEGLFKRVKQRPSDAIPFTRYLWAEDKKLSGRERREMEFPVFPAAMHFENMGQIFMRSGAGENDTYAFFSSGGIITQHRHYDNNNFVIYKKGFRALDSGTRPQPGQHLSHYYPRTVAHNCILIKMPGEEFPKYWGSPAASETPLPIPNDGGQQKIIGSKVIGYSQNDQYVYIASDATEAYHPEKAGEVIRQFLFIQPDVFVVFDKVESTSPDYKKTWLLHTAAEPVFLEDNEFFEEYDEGKMYCRTVFPQDSEMTKIGGPGKQFWSDGRNWPLPVVSPEDWNYRKSKNKVPLDTIPLLGQWRVEVSPRIPNNKDSFLHLIQVGDRSLNKMIDSKPIEQDGMKGLRFEYLGRLYEVLFHDSAQTGGQIRISQNGNTITDEPFTTQVEPQQSILSN